MNTGAVTLTARDAADAVRRRGEPTRALAGQDERIAAACRDMAVRFRRGGRLLTFGNGAATADAAHLAVEFVHPVIVGKRALPALSLVGDPATLTGIARRRGFDDIFAAQLRTQADRDDIAVGISADGACTNVARALTEAAGRGLLTVALVGGDGTGAVVATPGLDHLLVVRSTDPAIVKELHVTIYHVLWELAHVFLEQTEDRRAGAGR
ncbi:phosphoheptose isomerase [Actinomycetospora sp. NBRC 106375]|uniref:D-sedoheptulose-7-phosphate isomerase n=1 Tax=Actinomycetospora sp. NBRC 106375 TaxID=3032207 RepID=UPI0024A0F058|nr:SIS domain-containing protein [Actinomycetospora sp. NBRC 106375]GLZ44158.1 phosphoheptose isomerase [Actinomycetospora sp. NBRC 106375]